MKNLGVEVSFNLHLAAQVRPSKAGAEGLTVVQGRLPRITQVLALAIHIEEMVRRGEAKDYAEFARQRCVTRERISQVLKLIWLAPDIQVEILYLPPSAGGRYPISELRLRYIAEMLSWSEQRAAWEDLKRERRLLVLPETRKAAGD